MIIEFQSKSLKGVELKIEQYLEENNYFFEVTKITTWPRNNIWIANVEFKRI